MNRIKAFAFAIATAIGVLAVPIAARAASCGSLPYTFVDGVSYITAASTNANNQFLLNCAQNQSITAANIQPTTIAQATFGGNVAYTFLNGITVSGTANVNYLSANSFVITANSSESVLIPASSSAPITLVNAANTIINATFADTGGLTLNRGNLSVPSGNVSVSGSVTGSTLNLADGASIYQNGTSVAITGGSTATGGFYFANALNTAAIYFLDNSGDGTYEGSLSVVGAASSNSVSSTTSITAGTSISAGTTISATGNVSGAYGIFGNVQDNALNAGDCVQTTGTTLISAAAQCMTSISGGTKEISTTNSLSSFSCAAGVSCATTATGSWGYTFSSQPNCQATLESSSPAPLIVRCAATTTGYTLNFYNAGGGTATGTVVTDLKVTGS